ncbi:MAG: hypothetical protein CSB55_01360 [Candidatus Cloacimonadota bacterium]|nr:MAG: hypothetical protein CSB55_01360 [Candidatus Cloacimonadota bacterium]
MKYIITGSDYTSDLFSHLSKDIKILHEDDNEINDLVIRQEDMCYIPSETALAKVSDNFEDKNFKEKILKLKDKFLFRELTAEMFPDFFFKKTNINDLDKLKLDYNKRYILKPVRGFFGTGVYEFCGKDSLADLKNKFTEDVKSKSNSWDERVLATEEVIIESYIEGDEFAVDMFFDKDKNPQIENIYHHPFAEKKSYFHVLYYTGEEIFKKYFYMLKKFFVKLNKILNAENFPLHAEFKISGNTIIPVEINPLRFGGFGLGDLTYHAFNINPFQAFFDNSNFDWDHIWSERKGLYYGWILAYNGDAVDLKTDAPDYPKFKKYLKGEIMKFAKMDYKTNPVFAVVYAKTDKSEDLSRMLKVEFNDFFQKK